MIDSFHRPLAERSTLDLREPAPRLALSPDGSVPFDLPPHWRAIADQARQAIAERRRAAAPAPAADQEGPTP